MRFFTHHRPSTTVPNLPSTPPQLSSEAFDDKEIAIAPTTDIKDVSDSEGRDAGPGSDVDKETNLPNPNVQEGVRKVEAVTLTWSKRELMIAYALYVFSFALLLAEYFISKRFLYQTIVIANDIILEEITWKEEQANETRSVYLVFFVVSMEQQIQNNLSVYVTSSFALLPLTSTTQVVSSVVGGVVKLPTAKFIDLVGRAEGFALMTGLATLGLVLMAATRSVEMYAAAQVFYWVGFNGMAYVLDVFLADTSSLKNRALVFSFSTTPYIATTFIGPRAAQSFLETSGWPWGFDSFAIITPFISLPIMIILWRNQRRAVREGVLTKEKSRRTLWQSIKYYFWEFDVIGLLLISAGFILLLLPLSLANYQKHRYHTHFIIAMLVLGPVFLLLFALYEAFHPHKPFIPFRLLTSPTVLGACLFIAFFFISFYCWDSSFLNYLQAVHRLSVTNAGYVYNIYSIGSCFIGPFVALAIRFSDRFRWIALYVAIPLQLLGVGLLIHFRQPGTGFGYLIMCQIFIAFSGGACVITSEMAVMAAAPHENVAGMLALIGLFSSVGGAIGQAISGAIYTSKFPAELNRALNPPNATLAATLYGSLTSQLLYPWGSPERNAVVQAYGYTQKYLAIAGTAFLIPCFVCVWVWRDFRVGELKQVRGRIV